MEFKEQSRLIGQKSINKANEIERIEGTQTSLDLRGVVRTNIEAKVALPLEVLEAKGTVFGEGSRG